MSRTSKRFGHAQINDSRAAFESEVPEEMPRAARSGTSDRRHQGRNDADLSAVRTKGQPVLEAPADRLLVIVLPQPHPAWTVPRRRPRLPRAGQKLANVRISCCSPRTMGFR